MRIDAYNQINQIYKMSNTKKSQNAQKVSSSDQVTISRVGAEYNLARQALKAVPDVREELVSDIKRQITEGTYNVSGDSFADKLIARFNELA